MTRRTLPYLFILLAITAGLVFGQQATVQGILTDAQGAAVPGAKVVATDSAKKLIARQTTSQADGSFDLSPLAAGTYSVSIELKGFKTAEKRDLLLDLNQALDLGRIVMEVGAVTDSITVEAEVTAIETTTSQKSFVVTDRQVNELSLNGRDFQSLMKTLPGVVSNDQSDFRLAFNSTNNWNTNGLRGSMNNASLNGAINTDVGANDGQYTQVSVDSVAEFKLSTSTFNAENGRSASVMINAVLKSGSSSYHGTAYDFGRNDFLDANSYFRNSLNQPKAKLRFNQFGGNIGGPVYLPKFVGRANTKLFFFFNYEGTRATRPNGGAFVDVYNANVLTGDFSALLRTSRIAATQFPTGTIFAPGSITRDNSGNITGGTPYPGNILPQSMFSRNAPAFLKLLTEIDRSKGTPTPNVPEDTRVPLNDSYLFYKNAKVLRIDYHINPKNNVSFSWADDSQHESTGLGVFTSTSYPVFPTQRKKPGASWTVNVVTVLTPSMTNEAILNYNHLTQVVDVVPGTNPATYDRDKLGFTFQELYPSSNIDHKFPAFSGCGPSCNFGSYPADWRSEGKTFTLTDNFTIHRKKHQWKMGLFANRNLNGQQPNWTDAPNFNFGTGVNNPNDTNQGMANLLTGNYLSVAQTSGVYYGQLSLFGIEGYAQDTWRVNRQLTLELGARYVYQGPTSTYGANIAHYFDPALYDPSKAVSIDIAAGPQKGRILPGSGDPLNGLVAEGAPGVAAGFVKHRKDQVSPRLGFAYDVFGDGKTALRGGFGTFFERIQQNVFNFSSIGNPPLNYTPTLYGGNIDNLSSSLVAGGTRFPVGIVAANADGKVPTIYSWSLGLQKQLPFKTSLDIAYVGNTVRHLQYGRNLNQLPLGTTVNSNLLALNGNLNNAIVPYKGYSNVSYTDFGANSNYHSLQIRASRRYAKSFTTNVNYTWSKAIGDVDSDGNSIGYYLDRVRERAVSGFDRTHVINIDYVYNLPNFGSKYMNNRAGRTVLNGWEISGITKFQTGFPLTVTSGGNAGTLGGGIRADYVGGNLYPTQQTQLQFFNPFAFARPRDGSLGNTGRDILRGPHINQWDISLFKNTQINERMKVQFRLETFNTFNHTQWYGVSTGIGVGNPGETVSAATLGTTGQITSTRDPRNVQLSMKFYF